MKTVAKKGSPKEPSETGARSECTRTKGEKARGWIADDLVVSSTPRRIRRTSNSSADRYRVPGGLAREGGLRQGARGGRSNEGGRQERRGSGTGERSG